MCEEETNSQSASVIRYVVIFTVVYISILALNQLLVHAFNINLSYGANAIILIGSGMGAMIKFVRDHNRVPTKPERRRLVWFCYLSIIVASILFFSVVNFIINGVFIFHNIVQVLTILMFVVVTGGFLLVALTYYMVLRFIFGLGARYYFKKFIQ
jgi:membrane-associated HD superfamily phosphohydrolase